MDYIGYIYIFVDIYSYYSHKYMLSGDQKFVRRPKEEFDQERIGMK